MKIQKKNVGGGGVQVRGGGGGAGVGSGGGEGWLGGVRLDVNKELKFL